MTEATTGTWIAITVAVFLLGACVGSILGIIVTSILTMAHREIDDRDDDPEEELPTVIHRTDWADGSIIRHVKRVK